MSKRVALVSAVLLAALVVAVVGATAALRLIGGGTFGPGGRPLSEADVRRSLAAVRTTPPATPNPAGSTAPGGAGRVTARLEHARHEAGREVGRLLGPRRQRVRLVRRRPRRR